MLCKRKKVVISLEDKLNAIKMLDSGASLKTVAQKYDVGVSTVGDWKKNRNKIRKWCSVLAAPTKERKTMKTAKHEKIDQSLYLWFNQQRERGVPVSGPILQEKALSLSEDLPLTESPLDFTASDGWLTRWKKRHGVRALRICGEKLSANIAAVQDFIKQFNAVIESENYTLDQLYNCDETGLNFKMMPSKTLASRTEAGAPGYKKSKERITLLACSNSSGRHKLPIMCIGKSAKPRAFKHISSSTLPVYYRHQKSAWMDSNLFQNWFFEEFVPKVEKFLKKSGYPRKALLLIDNAPSHPKESDLVSGEIKAMFLPPNVTSLIQPMDQGVLETLKRHYRKLLLQSILEKIHETDCSLLDCLKQIDLKDVVYWVSDAWNKVKMETLEKSWSNLLRSQEKESTMAEEDSAEVEELFQMTKQLSDCEDVDKDNFTDWLEGDEQMELTDNEIISLVTHNDEEELNEEENVDESPSISHTEGKDALEIAIRFVS